MPHIDIEELSFFFSNLNSHSKRNEEEGIKGAKKYFFDNSIDISTLSIASSYYIISELKGDKQAEFIKENIQFIKENDDDIFIYNMLAPKTLAGFLSIESIRVLYSDAKDIFKRILNESFSSLAESLNTSDILTLYKEFSDEINNLDNNRFIVNLSCFKFKNRAVIDPIISIYKEKIDSFENKDLLLYFSYIITRSGCYEFIVSNKEKFIQTFSSLSKEEIYEYFYNLDAYKKFNLLNEFFPYLKNQPLVINALISASKLEDVSKLYTHHKNYFKNVSLESILKSGEKYGGNIDDNLKELLNSYTIDSIEMLDKFNTTKIYIDIYENQVSRYVEKKFRDSLICDGSIIPLESNTSIYSSTYLKNLKEIYNLKLSKDDPIYLKHLDIFIKYLVDKEIIDIPEEDAKKQLDIYFYRICKGELISDISKISSIKDITMINRIRNMEFHPYEFSINQLQSYNVKEHRALCNIHQNASSSKTYKTLVLKLILMVGYNNAKYLLSIDNSLPTLEHLTGNVDVTSVKLDNQGKPMLNKRFINMMFNDKDNPRIKQMLLDKSSLLYKYFPRIFNEWDLIELNHKSDKLSNIFEYIEGEEVHLPIKYYKLENELKYIGIKNRIITEAMEISDKMNNRVTSTIPRVVGKVNDYEYEILRYEDIEGISVGNKTNCCFTVLGRGYSCLKHALTSKNGRLLVVKKDGKLIAHSWLWRNGDLLCIDNIEVNSGVHNIDFFDIYKEMGEKIVNITNEYEKDNGVKVVTLGRSSFDAKVKELSSYSCLKDLSIDTPSETKSIILDSLPQPIERITYSDSNKIQYILIGDENYNLYQSSHLYMDERKEVINYVNGDEVNKTLIENKLNYLRYLKSEDNNTQDNFNIVSLNEISSLYMNNDWYIVTYKDGRVDSYKLNIDYRSDKEYEYYKNIVKSNIQIKIK